VSDQIGAPTSARLIAVVMQLCLKQTINERQSGEFSSNLYHLTASGSTSWFGFIEKIVRLAISSLDKELKLRVKFNFNIRLPNSCHTSEELSLESYKT
jgi:dTDP-4-dehydrorhamnose reductase